MNCELIETLQEQETLIFPFKFNKLNNNKNYLLITKKANCNIKVIFL